MKILITGATGLVGRHLTEHLRLRHPDAELYPMNRQELDITDRQRVEEVFKTLRPDFAVNCAAYTKVDQAEIERDKCYAVNVEGTRHLASAAARTGSTLVHLSTDYIFDGKKRSPYVETDPANPLNYYGLTKWESEQVTRELLDRRIIIRPAWIYGKYRDNFVTRVLQWARGKDVIYASNDQTGSPTRADELAEFIAFMIFKHPQAYGTYHFSGEGEATRYDMAVEIIRTAGLNVRVEAVPSSFFKPLAKRPPYSVLSKEKIKRLWQYPVRHWRESLREFVKEIVSL
ncbi:MAG: dTDP-4-dehydrorhamnose reductase [Chlorobi bacterium]|nr:dTDP-4-dehydrorhamnose reductase [Chlorobiota bacterium]